MSALVVVKTLDGAVYGYRAWCPGCEDSHVIPVAPPHGTEAARGWKFNGDVERPTFEPSILVSWKPGDPNDRDNPPRRCHSYLRDGAWQYLADSTHALAGKTVRLTPEPL